jgi:hypothetical protein
MVFDALPILTLGPLTGVLDFLLPILETRRSQLREVGQGVAEAFERWCEAQPDRNVRYFHSNVLSELTIRLDA